MHCQKRGTQFFLGECDLHRNYGLVVTLLSFLCNYDTLILKLHQRKRRYPDEGWVFIGRFKVGSVQGMTVTNKTPKKVSKSIMNVMQDH